MLEEISLVSVLPSGEAPVVDFDSDVSWEHLTVLDMGYVRFCRTTISSLSYMVHLRYVELHMYFLMIPDWISSFYNYGRDSIPKPYGIT